MIIGKVIGNVWATRKEKALNGLKLMVVQRLYDQRGHEPEVFVAVDFVGSGIGERVLIAMGSAARKSPELTDAPVDAVIVGIIDEVEIKDN